MDRTSRTEDVASRALEAAAARVLARGAGGYVSAERAALTAIGDVAAQRIRSLLAAANRLAEHACRSRLGAFDVLGALVMLDGETKADGPCELLAYARAGLVAGPALRLASLDAPGRVLLRAADDRWSDDEDDDDEISVPVPMPPPMVAGIPRPMGMIPPFASMATSPVVSPTIASAMPRMLVSGQSSGVVSPVYSPGGVPYGTAPYAHLPFSPSASAPTSPTLPYAMRPIAAPQPTMTLGPLTTRRVRAERAPRPAYMLEIYPPLPRPHTFRWTETRGVRETDAVALARARAEQQRLAEAALARLCAQRLGDRPLVNYEDALFGS